MKFQLDSTENTWKQVSRKDIALLLEFQKQSTAGLEGINCKFEYVNAPPLKIILITVVQLYADVQLDEEKKFRCKT